MKNYLKPYTMCTKVESEGYLLAGTGGGTNGQITKAKQTGAFSDVENSKSNVPPMPSKSNTTLSKGVFFESED